MKRTTAVAASVAHLVGPGQLKVINQQLGYVPLDQPPLRLDPRALDRVLCYGDVAISAPAVQMLLAHGVQTAWLSAGGNRCHGRLLATDPPTTLTRVRQHQVFAQREARLAWAREVVAGKLQAMARTARHHQRHGCSLAGPVLTQLSEIEARVPLAATLDEVRGLEGVGSAAWFRLLGGLLMPPWLFEQRRRRPPPDPINALLSLGYTWLLRRTEAQAEAQGYEIYLGGLHAYRPGRPSLACDLMEPLRISAVDRWVLAVCNRKELKPEDFEPEETGGLRLRKPVFASTLHSWEGHWQEQRQDDVLEQWLTGLGVLLRQWTPPAEETCEEVCDL